MYLHECEAGNVKNTECQVHKCTHFIENMAALVNSVLLAIPPKLDKLQWCAQ